MACTQEFIDFVCQQIESIEAVRSRQILRILDDITPLPKSRKK